MTASLVVQLRAESSGEVPEGTALLVPGPLAPKERYKECHNPQTSIADITGTIHIIQLAHSSKSRSTRVQHVSTIPIVRVKEVYMRGDSVPCSITPRNIVRIRPLFT